MDIDLLRYECVRRWLNNFTKQSTLSSYVRGLREFAAFIYSNPDELLEFSEEQYE